jgi:hypothetical protein
MIILYYIELTKGYYMKNKDEAKQKMKDFMAMCEEIGTSTKKYKEGSMVGAFCVNVDKIKELSNEYPTIVEKDKNVSKNR